MSATKDFIPPKVIGEPLKRKPTRPIIICPHCKKSDKVYQIKKCYVKLTRIDQRGVTKAAIKAAKDYYSKRK